VFWDYLQYALGFTRLGDEVLYLEDTGKWCYDTHLVTFVEFDAPNAEYLARELPRLASELGERWFFRDATGATWSWSWGPCSRILPLRRPARAYLCVLPDA
jgi:hypothetical protein